MGVYQWRGLSSNADVRQGLALPRMLVSRAARIYTLTIGAAQAAWSAVRARCIFSECLNESTLHVIPGAPPGISAGPDHGRAGMRLLQGMAGRTNAALRSVLDDLATTVFPSDCRVCNRPLPHYTFLPICDLCRASVQPQVMTMCDRCGEALDIDMESACLAGQLLDEGVLCSDCRADPPMFERAVAYAVYQGELREMIHLLKYERMDLVAKLLGGMLAESILTLQTEAAQELVVVAVPLFPAKQRQRGYNQSALLADAAIADLRRSHPQWLLTPQYTLMERHRDTRSQFELNSVSRRVNIQGAFRVNSNIIAPGSEVLLVDDIYTTGATARECSRVLRRAGASKIWVATLARAQKPRVALWDNTKMHDAQGFG